MSHVARLCPACDTEIGPALVPVNFFVCPKCGLVDDTIKLKTSRRGQLALAGMQSGASAPAPAINTATDWSQATLSGPIDNITVNVAGLLAGSAVIVVLGYDNGVNLSSFTANAAQITATINTPIVNSNALVAVLPYSASSITLTANFDAPAAFISLYACEVRVAAGGNTVALDKNNYGVNGTDPSRSSYTSKTSQDNECIVGVLVTEGPVSDSQPTWDSPLVSVNRIGTAYAPAGSNSTIAVAQYKATAAGTFRSGASGLSSRTSFIWCGTFK